jgi:hypothetical protein
MPGGCGISATWTSGKRTSKLFADAGPEKNRIDSLFRCPKEQLAARMRPVRSPVDGLVLTSGEPA